MTSVSPAVVVIGSAFERRGGGERIGGAAELAIALATASGERRTSVVTRVGDDAAGAAIRAALAEAGLDLDTVQVDPDLPTGRLAAKAFTPPSEQRLDQPAAFDHLQWDGELASLAAESEWVLFDATSRRHAQSRSTIDRFLHDARGATRIFDLSMRPPEGPQRVDRLGRAALRVGLEEADAAIVDLAIAADLDLSASGDAASRLESLRRLFRWRFVLGIEPGEPMRLALPGGDGRPGVTVPTAPAEAMKTKARALLAILKGEDPASVVAGAASGA
jgi:sugar/nucleoside kinase (ribokinase family)